MVHLCTIIAAMTTEKLLPNTLEAADRLLDWVGAEDGSGGADHFIAVLEGPLADAVMKSINDNPDWYGRFLGKRVNVFRSGGLEINCDGFYTEGLGCRAVIHRAVAKLKDNLGAAKRIAPLTK